MRPRLTVGDLRRGLDASGLPDDAVVLVEVPGEETLGEARFATPAIEIFGTLRPIYRVRDPRELDVGAVVSRALVFGRGVSRREIEEATGRSTTWRE